MRRTLILSALIVGLSGSAGFADEPADLEAKKVVQTLGDQTVAAAKIEDKDARRRQLAEAAAPTVDFTTIGTGVLSYVGVQVPANRQAEILDGVIAFVGRAIVAEIERIRPEEAKLGAASAKSDHEVRVGMTLAGVKDQIDADWVVRKQPEGWRITDVVVQGNSLTQHFGGVLSRRARGEVDQLVEFLRSEQKRDKVAQLSQ